MFLTSLNRMCPEGSSCLSPAKHFSKQSMGLLHPWKGWMCLAGSWLHSTIPSCLVHYDTSMLSELLVNVTDEVSSVNSKQVEYTRKISYNWSAPPSAHSGCRVTPVHQKNLSVRYAGFQFIQSTFSLLFLVHSLYLASFSLGMMFIDCSSWNKSLQA